MIMVIAPGIIKCWLIAAGFTDGSEPNTANFAQGYVEGIWQIWQQQRAEDRGEDNGDRPGDNKVLADSRRVKPVAHLHVDQRFKGLVDRQMARPGASAPLQLITDGSEPNTANFAQGYVGRAIWRSKSTGMTTMARMRPACIS
jgi:hypothetical protein